MQRARHIDAEDGRADRGAAAAELGSRRMGRRWRSKTKNVDPNVVKFGALRLMRIPVGQTFKA
jgi:hypothetical protein